MATTTVSSTVAPLTTVIIQCNSDCDCLHDGLCLNGPNGIKVCVCQPNWAGPSIFLSIFF